MTKPSLRNVPVRFAWGRALVLLVLGALTFSAPSSAARKKIGKEGRRHDVTAITGRFSAAPIGYVGRLILELSADGTYSFINLVSMHLPPQELENRRGKVIWQGDKGCLEPPPEAIEACVTAKGPDAIAVVQKKAGQSLTLQRIVEDPAHKGP